MFLPDFVSSRLRIGLCLLLAGLILATGNVYLHHAQEPEKARNNPVGRFGGDGAVRWRILQEIATQETYPDAQGVPALQGIGYSAVQPILALPVYIAGLILGQEAEAVAYFNLIILLVAIVVMLGWWPDKQVALYTCLLWVAGSMLPYHLRFFYAEVLTAFLVFLGLWATAGNRYFLGGVLTALGVANTPATLPALLLVVLVQIFKTRRLRHLLAVAMALGIVFTEAMLRRGSPLDLGYNGGPKELQSGPETILPFSGRPGFSYPLGFGLLNIFFSFGKGLIWFTPGIFLSLKHQWDQMNRTSQDLYLYAMVFLGGMLPVYATWWSWYGGWFWGPRFFLPAAVIGSMILAYRLRFPSKQLTDLLTLAVLTLCIWTGFVAMRFGDEGLGVCFQNPQIEFVCHNTPEYSGLWYPLWQGIPMTMGNLITLGYGLILWVYLGLPLLQGLYPGISIYQAKYMKSLAGSALNRFSW